MRFMLLMIPKGYEGAPPDAEPDAKAVETMMRYNESLREAGVLLALDGLHPVSAGARVSFSGAGTSMVTDGPFIETREAVGGYWMIRANSKAEAVEWASRCPGRDCVIEVRQVFELDEFPAEAREVAAKFPELRARFGGGHGA